MIRLLALSLLAAAQERLEPPPAPPEPVMGLPAHFACSVRQEGPFGEVGAQQFVSPDGVADVRLDSWSMSLVPGGVTISASWEHPDPARYNLVWLTQIGLDRGRSYRIQVQRDVPNGQSALLLESPLTRPDSGGTVHVHTRWEALTAMLADAADPRMIVIRDDGEIVRSDAVDPAVFARALATVTPLQPLLDAMIADYRGRCPFSQGRSFPPPELNVVPDRVAG